MKKIILILIGFLILPLNIFAVDEIDYYIDEYKVEADVKANGNMEVCEYIKQSGSFNGYVRDLFYKSGDITYSPTNLKDIVVYDLNVANMSKGNIFMYDDNAIKGDILKYKIENIEYEPTVTMYNATEDSTSGYVLCYTLENAILVHNDVAELYYNFIPNGFEDVLNNVGVKVNLPRIDESLRVWGHGALHGVVRKEENTTNSYLLAKIDYVNPGEVVNVRMTFDKTLVSDSTRLTNIDALDNILKEEQKLANKANMERQKEKIIVGFAIVEFILFVIFLIYVVIKTYFKYDKEHKVDLNMEYYREFPNSYGPETLEYLIKKRNTTNSYSASILNIIYKKCLNVEYIEDKKDYILTKIDKEEDLTGLEKGILDYIINDIGNGKSVSLKEIKRYGRKESTANDFLKHFENWKNDVKKDAEQYNFYEKNHVGGLATALIIFTVVTFFIGIISEIYITSYIAIWLGVGVSFYVFGASKRTKNGMLEYKKWMAFKKFLNDFGRFDEKELPEIVLWEKYMVYATVLGVAERLEKTMKIKINDYNDVDFTTGDIILMNHMLRHDFVSSMNSSINKVYTASRSTIASSSSSSGVGSGGGFSGGGSFSGGGGGGGGHGF